MYAVIESGGKQYKVAKNDIILVELLDAKEGGTVKIEAVMLAGEGESVKIGTPFIKGATVTCEVLGTIRRDKVTAYKYKKRKSEKKKIGHRQGATKLKVTDIKAG